jgi:hypothetical protein
MFPWFPPGKQFALDRRVAGIVTRLAVEDQFRPLNNSPRAATDR